MSEGVTAQPLPRIAWVLGLAGLIPQAAAVLATFDPEWRFIGLAAGYLYAVLIFSFLGGLWWGVAAARRDAPEWRYVAAVVPSLLALASGIPWMTGATWPGPSLGWLGVGIAASWLVDRRFGRLGLVGADYVRLRGALSAGLGALTFLLALR